MTNQPTDDALVEELARLMHDSKPSTLIGAWDSNDVPDWVRKVMRDYATALLPLVREAQAEAWDEGYAAGFTDGSVHYAWDDDNPHRAATYEGDET